MLFSQFSSIALIIDYELRRLKIDYRRTSSILTTLKHRFLRERNNVINVSYIFNKTDFLIRLTSF